MKQIINQRRWLIPFFVMPLLFTGGGLEALGRDCPTKECEEAFQKKQGDDRNQSEQSSRRRSSSEIEYTLWNSSNETVYFRLPTGKKYKLKPGQTGHYKNTGNRDKFKIHVFNSGRTYALKSGDHKFFWNRKKNRIGLDLNYAD